MASTNFINECKNRANKNRLGKIIVDGFENPITNSDNLQSFSIDSGCYVNGNIIGSVYAKCLKANFVSNIANLDNQNIITQIGVKYDDLSDEYINMGKYKIERPNNEITTDMSQITAYDSLYTKLDDKYVCGIDYENEDVTLKDLYIDVCNQLELVPKTTNILNGDIPILSNPFTNGEKNRTVLQTIAKTSCSFVDINNDTNQIDLCWLSRSEEPDYVFYKNDYVSVDGGQVVCGPINCLIIKNSVVDDENVTIKDEESIKTDGEHSIIISEDYILHNAELREQAITAIWNRVKGMKYVDCKLTTCYGKPFLKLGDRIRIYTSETEYFNTYVLKHQFTYDGTFASVIESPALTEQEIKAKQDIGLKEALYNTQIDVNKQGKSIKSLIQKTDVNENKIAQQQIMLDTIEQQISGEYGMEREVSGVNQVFIEDALKYYPLEIKITGYSNTKSLLYPGTFYPGVEIVPIAYQEPPMATLTICVDSQDRSNPTENLKEYTITIGEPLRSLGTVKDELEILITDDGEFSAQIMRYLAYTGSQIVKLDKPTIEAITYPQIELLKHSNYVYIKEQPNYQIYIKYLIYSELNRHLATKVELATSRKQTEDSIIDTVSATYSTKEELAQETSQRVQTATEIIDTVSQLSNSTNNLSTQIKQKATSVEIIANDNQTSAGITVKLKNEDGTELDSKSANISMSGLVKFTDLSSSGSTIINGSNITTGTIDASKAKITNIDASNITTGTLTGDKIRGGTISGTTINTDKDLTVGNNVYIGQNQTSNSDVIKYLYFSQNAYIRRWVMPSGGNYLAMYSNLNTRLSCNDTGYINVMSDMIQMSHQANISSDKRLKKKIKNVDVSWIDDLKIKEFEYKNTPNKKQIGLIAQDYVDKEYSKYFLNQNKDENDYYSITYGNITNALIQYCQEMKNEINLLKQEIEVLKNER